MPLELIELNSSPVVAVNCDNQKVAKERKRHKAAWKIEELSNQEPILVMHFFLIYYWILSLLLWFY